MKLKSILSAFAAVALFAVGCTEEPIAMELAELQVSDTYVALPTDGGNAAITVTANADWAFCTSGKQDTIPAWLTISPVSGAAGETNVTFTAGAATSTKEAIVKILVGGTEQYIHVQQGVKEAAKPSTCAEINAGPDNKTYQVTGTCVQIANTQYGNWYIEDATGKVYIYGTLNKGETQKFSSLDPSIEVGDVITIEGPKTTYNGTVELVDVTVIKVVKSLIKADKSEISASKEGGDFEVKFNVKGDNFDVAADQDWINVSNIKTVGDTTFVTVTVQPNVDDARTGNISFSSSKSGSTSVATIAVAQATGIAGYPLPFVEDFSAGIGRFSINDIVPVAGKNIWTPASYNTSYYMKASSGGKVDSESDLVSANIDLANAKTATLSFEHTHKYAGNVYEELTLWVSTDFGATWNQLLIPAYGTNNDYNFVACNVSLNRFVGNVIQIAFKYKSNANAYATWEVAKINVTADDAVLKSVADIDNYTSKTTDVEFKATLTNAVVSYINGSNAFIEDATGGIQLYMKNHNLKAGQTINGEISGKAKLYGGYPEMTSIDVTKATIADGAEPAGVELTLDKLLKSYLRYQNCKVVIKDVDITTGIAKDARDGVVAQNGATIALRAQVNGVTMEAGKGTLTCWPTQYNGKLQLGAWDNAHFAK